MTNQVKIDLFHEALNYACQLSGATDLKLKEKQYEVLKPVVLGNKDVLAILFTAIRHLKQFLYRTFSLGLVPSFHLWLCPQTNTSSDF